MQKKLEPYFDFGAKCEFVALKTPVLENSILVFKTFMWFIMGMTSAFGLFCGPTLRLHLIDFIPISRVFLFFSR
jgi:hypothetical protein